MVDTLDVIGRFGRQASYGRPFALADGIKVTFLDAGHILGSASLFFEIEEDGRTTTILFSGDIGNEGRPLLRSPQTPPSADYVVMEGTYGDRDHRPFADSVAELFAAVRDALGRGANALIPTFALERTQDILFAFHQGVRDGVLPATMPVFLDSPMAISATEIFRRHPECFPPEIRRSLSRPNDPFSLAGLRLTRETIDSVAINRITGGAVIMAGSGMCTGGRIRHHLVANIDNPSAGIIFVGFAAQGTLARRIIDGARHVRILGDEVVVRAHIHTINGFSAHAGRRELIDWHNRVKSRKATFLVHAEARAMSALARSLHAPRLEMPALHQAFEL